MLVLALVAACGSSEIDLSGVYMVTSDVGSMPCGTDQPIVGAPAFIQFQKMNLLGHDYFAFQDCPDATGTSCTDPGDIFDAFYLSTSLGWENEETESSNGGDTSCELTYILSTADLDGKQLVIEGNMYSDLVCLPMAQCTTDEAQKRGTTMPCSQHEHLEATKQ